MKAIFACAISVVIVLLLGGIEQSPVAASSSSSKPLITGKEFFRGKNVTLLVPSDPGTVFDLTARIISDKLKQILDARLVVVKNEGGGHMTAVNYFYNRVKPDGLTLMHFSLGGRGWSQLMNAPGIEFDVRQFIPVAQMHAPPAQVLQTGGSLHLKTISDLKSLKQFRVGTTGRYSDSQLLTTLLFENFSLSNAKFIVGYDSTGQVMLAIQKNEVEANAAISASGALAQKKAIDSGTYGLFTVYSERRLEAFPEVPTVFELGEWRADLKNWLNNTIGICELKSTWVLPPGTPPDRVAFLRQVFEDLWKDSQVNKGMMDMYKGYAMFRSGSETEQVVKKTFPKQKLSEGEVAFLNKLMDKWSSK